MEFSSDWISAVFFLHYFSYENINYIAVKWRVICIQATVAVGIKRALQTNVEIATPRLAAIHAYLSHEDFANAERIQYKSPATPLREELSSCKPPQKHVGSVDVRNVSGGNAVLVLSARSREPPSPRSHHFWVRFRANRPTFIRRPSVVDVFHTQNTAADNNSTAWGAFIAVRFVPAAVAICFADEVINRCRPRHHSALVHDLDTTSHNPSHHDD
ncbi:Uncharacterized protein FWK35_00016315 [Aphis craccivora]|uniref:Uncharacterized protein n=1 Tax=Aphis craccivora TaxID=307492 RepID=A0A6G0ZK28_APHCR|nr:Uncharacterized protein FWK35_00016315 [Aphis craccivora]